MPKVPLRIREYADDVVIWRVERLLEAGYGDELAVAMAQDPGVDLHRAIALVEAGCPPALAAEILL